MVVKLIWCGGETLGCVDRKELNFEICCWVLLVGLGGLLVHK